MRSVLQDFRYAFRQLRKQPGFTLTAVLTLALGIGSATAVFSVAYGVLIDPFPYKDVNTLATPKLCSSQWSQCGWNVYSPDAFNTIVKNTTIFSGVTASTISPVVLTGSGEPQQIRGNYITPNTFDVMGVQPILGRASNDSDVQAGHGEVALLSYRYWQSHFGGSPSILGRVVEFNGHPRTIIGVMPPRFLWRGADVYLPILMEGGESVQGQRNFALVGRVKPGVTDAQASAELQAVFGELSHKVQHAYPRDLRLSLMPFPEMFKSALGGTLYLLLGAVGVLLLIACVNVCGLLLARAVNREHEFVVRASVGASRQRLIRYALTESLLLAVIAIPIAVTFAYAGLQLTLRIIPPDTIPDESVVTMNIPVLLTSIGIALLTVFVSGLAPAWHSAHPRLSAALNGNRASGNQSQRRVLSSFVVTEIALSLALLTTAGLMFRSLLVVEHQPPSFPPDHTLAMQVPLDRTRYPTAASQFSFYRQLMEKTRALPGVKDVTIDDAFPFVDMRGTNVQLPGQDIDKHFVVIHFTTPSYPSMAQLRMISGHFLDDREIESGAHEIVVTENFAHRYFEGRNALNQVIHLPDFKALPKDGLKDDTFVIVGVMANLPSYLGFSLEHPQIYLPYTVVPAVSTLIVSTALNADSMMQPVRQAVYSIDKDQPVSQASSLRQMLEMYGYAGPRFALALFGTFAGAALLLSFVGIYGVLSFVTAQRTKEIGIRMALGANRTSVMWMVLRHAAILAFIGVAAGIPLAFAAGRFAREAELLRTSQFDPLVLFSAMSLLPLLAIAGTWLPARRAAAIDPIRALRTE